jgi:hypothetical protein
MSKTYAHYLTVLQYQTLNTACIPLAKAYDIGVFLVGSVLYKPDFRDVDVRAILVDEDYDRMFKPKHEFVNCSLHKQIIENGISAHLSQMTGLPIDFQFQRMTDCNNDPENKDKSRNALGIL